ncbi:hypothetical protein [Streptomyces sp. NRRL F-3307]
MTQPTLIRRVCGRRPRLLDLFCCPGGLAKGYAAHLGAAFLASLSLEAAA